MSKPISDRRPAIAGETFVMGPQLGIVAEKSAATSGQWICISCGVLLEHNLDKDLHCARRAPKRNQNHMVNVLGGPARHVLAFLVVAGNVEVP